MSKNTIRIVFNIFIFSLTCAATSDAQPTADPAVTYIANEGFLIEGGGASVLVDAIFTESWGKYATPPPEVLAAMRGAEGPFAKIDLVLITHSHPDHFRGDYVLEFMRHNERAVLIAPADAIGMMKTGKGFNAVAPRVTALSLARGQVWNKQVHGIEVMAFRLTHNDDDGSIPQMGYVWTARGRTFFHAGDAAATSAGECEAFIPETGVDIAFIPWWVLADWEQGQALLGRVRPQQAVYFTHTPLTDIGRVKSLTESHRASLPLTVIPEKQMETVRFRDLHR